MQTAHALNSFVAGAEEQVVGVRQNDFGVQIVDEIARCQALDGALGADGHEYRRLNYAMRGVQQSGTRAGLRAGCLYFEM
jgi:hypothetical protein